MNLTPNKYCKYNIVYKDGKVCISILHEAKEDQFNQQESIDEKWRPILSVEAIIISVLSMLSEPNFSSPANMYVPRFLLHLLTLLNQQL